MDEARVRGWIYVMTNSVMPGLVKVGKDPTEIAVQFRETGNPEPFVVFYDALVTGYHGAERQVHKELEQDRYKSKVKEWSSLLVPGCGS